MRKILFGLLSFLMATPVLPTDPSPLSQEQVHQIEQVVRNYLIHNPSVLVEASMALKEQEQDQLENKTVKLIKTHQKEIFEDSNNPVDGNPKGSIILVEFFDYQCGHCKHIYPVIEKAIEKNHSIKVVYKELPIFKGNSLLAAQAALSANQQGKFKGLHQALFSAKDPLTEDNIMASASKLGLDTGRLSKDMKSKEIENAIDRNMKQAQWLLQDTVGYLFTPVIILSNKDHSKIKFIPGGVSAEQLHQAIKEVQD